ncbi:unnamed protein product, partial [Cylicostephanus goldi]
RRSNTTRVVHSNLIANDRSIRHCSKLPYQRLLTPWIINGHVDAICTVLARRWHRFGSIDYKQECDRLDKRFVSRPPEPLTIPTVDGTYDARRLNEHAKQQAEKAQLLRCRKCYAKVSLREADEHNCGRFDPPVEFYF